jgi:hypothetical protein
LHAAGELESIASMTHRLVFGILYLLVAVAAFATSVYQKREGKDFRGLQVLGFLMLMCAVAKIWSN